MDDRQVLDKRSLIRKHVRGLSYVDIGGLWGTTGETVTTALLAGASRGVMADIQEPGGHWWQKFEEHCDSRGVTGYEEMQVDICAADAPTQLGSFDFVHCAGVMYHVPDLFRFLGNLVSVTKRYLLLSSVVMPSHIRGSAGSMTFGPDNSYLAPILSSEHRDLIGEYFEERGVHADRVSPDLEYVKDGEPRYGPWWWLFSSEFMTRVVGVFGMEVVAEGATPKGKGYTVLAAVPGSRSQ